jgi:hypothetical protein
MRRSNDDSVMQALSELRSMEEERAREQALAARRMPAERARAEARQQAEQDHAHKVVEVEARMRVEAELRRRDAEAEARIDALRAELNAVQSARDSLRLQILERGAAIPPERASTARGWQTAFWLAFAATFALAGLLFLKSTTSVERPIAPSISRSFSAENVKVATSRSPEAAQKAFLPAAPSTSVPKISDAASAKASLPNTKKRPTKAKQANGAGSDGLDKIDKCGNDPTCGANLN